MRTRQLVFLGLILIALPLAAADKPLALAVEVAALGRGNVGTVMGVLVQVAPEDRARLGKRARLTVSLIDGKDVVDRHSTVVTVEDDGTVLLHREWAVGTYELRVGIAVLEGEVGGMWIGDIKVPTSDEPFVAGDDAPPDAVVLELTPPLDGGVRFLPPPDLGGIGGAQLEVEVPDATASVEFFHDGTSVGRRNRPPWTVSVPLGDIVRRTMVTAVARDSRGLFLGEDAIVLNNPTGQLGVEILLAPEDAIVNGRRTVTVAVTGGDRLHQITLHLDEQLVAKWAGCPCVVELEVERLAEARVFAAEAVDVGGKRGESVITVTGEGGFSGSVMVELVELPVTVLNQQGGPVAGLELEDFVVFEDDQQVDLEGFATTADLPLGLAMAVDISGSMTEVFPQVQQAATGFADELLETGDEVTLLTFSWDVTVELPWTDQTDALGGKLERVIPEGGTSLHDAVVRSLEQFRGRRGRQALVLLTDGEDTTSRTDWDGAQRYAHTMRVPIFPIGLGLGRFDFGARKVLNRLAEESGGEAFFPKQVEELPQVYDRIRMLLRSQYLLWYRSSSDKPYEQFREVRVELVSDGHTVKTIRGYYPGK